MIRQGSATASSRATLIRLPRQVMPPASGILYRAGFSCRTDSTPRLRSDKFAMIEDTLFPFDLPIVARKKVTAAFDGGRITSNAGVMLLAQAGRRLGIAGQLARVIPDERHAGRVIHLLPDILRARIFAIACGYEDADDLDRLRVAPSRFFAVFADWSKALLTALRAPLGSTGQARP